MKAFSIFLVLFLTACMSANLPDGFVRSDIQTDTFVIATWQKITAPGNPCKVYIEGDGYAFDSRGRPTGNPTPHGKFVRNLAFADNSPNVVYLARPCQFTDDTMCQQKYWTTARFSPPVIDAEYAAIQQICSDAPVILVGYSGGAAVAGLIATTKEIDVKKLVTIAGNLDHKTWTAHKGFVPLDESLSLTDYRDRYLSIPQTHYIGERDKVIPPQITIDFINDKNYVLVHGATHNRGFESVYTQIQAKN